MKVWLFLHLVAWWAYPLARHLPVHDEKIGNSTYAVRSVGPKMWAYAEIDKITPWQLRYPYSCYILTGKYPVP